ncbi:hypothetical protein AUJ46_03345 [Candidatus Peregrinibacteria bacterium CG1_02_54_53]|nr:MAG: hypothetical protein AUJ46_03345 [Candidatus Peregrinibacteria bacterium CG1_02_54_53]
MRSILSQEPMLLRASRCVAYGGEKHDIASQIEEALNRRHELIRQMFSQRVPYEKRNFDPPR